MDEMTPTMHVLVSATGVNELSLCGNSFCRCGALTDLGGVHSKQMFLCRFVFASVGTKALSHHQHEVLFRASKHHQILVRLGHQRFLNTQMHRYSCYDDVLIKKV